MTVRPPELDMALICEEAGIRPMDLTVLTTRMPPPVTRDSISRLFPRLDHDNILGLISVACRANAMDRVEGPPSTIRTQSWNIRAKEFAELISAATMILDLLPHLRGISVKEAPFRIAATIPDSLISLHRFYGAFENTALGMRRVVEDSRDVLYIVSPFFSREGVENIAPSVESALRRGVCVKVLARCLSPGEQNRRALEGLLEVAKTTPGTLSLHETESKDGSPLLHAKILARDDGEEVYVGSANLTGAGMERTLEVGVFLKGEQAKEIVRLIQELDRLSEPR